MVSYQVDVYNCGPETDALLQGGVLTDPSGDENVAIPGGDGTAWKLVAPIDCQ
jgi:hypothetical protein